MVSAEQQQVISNCQRSCSWFLRNFVKVKHPSAGILPFIPFEYQKQAIKAFRSNRFNIFRKCRQCFRGDQIVDTPSGGLPISQVVPGQPVYTVNPGTGLVEVAYAEQAYFNGLRPTVTVELDRRQIVSTADHPFVCKNGIRTPADFTPEEQLLVVDSPGALASASWHGDVRVRPGELAPVYDLRVPPFDNYMVAGAVVHNCGASKISGAYALWFAMFHPHKTVLIISRTDEDAMNFLNENVRFSFRHLPEWMQTLWDPKPYKDNEHEIKFPNGSRIRSLSSAPDVLRSNASSLNIIDEAAFIPNMDVLWAGGFSTLQHGGSVIVISTTNGTGGWYWSTWNDAEQGKNGFNPISINWWDMDWVVEYVDSMSREPRRIAPTDGLRKCTTEQERDKYGEYWSPWLEEQYNALQEQGDPWKFEQEVLASFVGSGNTVLSKNVLFHVARTIQEPAERISGMQVHVHPVSGERTPIDFTFNEEPDQGLWIWKRPVVAVPDKMRGREVVERGRPAHSYVIGVDLATGKGRDYHALEVFDVDEMEQVAEFMGRCLPRDFKKVVDWVGRWYNCALVVIERNNGGDNFIDEMRYDLMYPRLWRKRDIDDKPRRSSNANPVRLSQYGFMTTVASKPILNKYLLDYVRDKEDEGYRIYSRRLLRQFQTYVRKKDKLGKDTGRTEAEEGNNFDDLVMACAMSLVGAPDAVVYDATSLIPQTPGQGPLPQGPPLSAEDLQRKFIDLGGPALMMPVTFGGELPPEQSAQMQLDQFALQLGGVPISDQGGQQAVGYRKHILDARRRAEKGW